MVDRDYLEQIREYIDGTLSSEERQAFEAEMQRNADLREAVEQYPLVIDALTALEQEEASVAARAALERVSSAEENDPQTSVLPKGEHATDEPGKPFRLRSLFNSRNIILTATAAFVALAIIVNIVVEQPSKDVWVAVLPFEDLTPGGVDEHLADGLVEYLTSQLARVDHVRVRHNTTFAFRGTEKDYGMIREQADVRYVIEGTFAHNGDEIVIHATRVDLDKPSKRRSWTITGSSDSYTSVRANLARSIVNQGFSGSLEMERSTMDQEAIELVMRAEKIHRETFQITNDSADFLRAETLLLDALEIEPDYLEAHAELSLLYDSHRNRIGGADSLVRVMVRDNQVYHTTRALALDRRSAHAQFAAGWLHLTDFMQWVQVEDLRLAHDAFLHAAQRSFFKYPYALDGLAQVQWYAGLADEAQELFQQAAQAALIDEYIHSNFRLFMYLEGQYLQVIPALRKALRYNPGDNKIRDMLVEMYCVTGQPDLAARYANQADSNDEALMMAARGDRQGALNLNPGNTWVYVILGEWDTVLRRGGYELFVQRKYLFLKDVDQHTTQLIDESALDVWESFKDHPTFPDLLEQCKQWYEQNKNVFTLRGSLLDRRGEEGLLDL